MAAKIQKSSDSGTLWFPSRFCSSKLIIVMVFLIGSHVMILQIIWYLVIIILIILPSSASILSGTFLGDALIKLMKPCRNIICHVKLCL
jgi:hypothetical protein